MSEISELRSSSKFDGALPAQIAVLITCYNRKDVTLACLDALYRQWSNLDVYLVDDGSTDGTSDAVKAKFSMVKILTGNGSLFWAGGMHEAFEEALKVIHPYYLWLNDDTILQPKAIAHLLETHQRLSQRGYEDSIVVGSVKDPKTHNHTYGGRCQSKEHSYHKFVAVLPGKEEKECDTMQGNIVLIPRSVATKVGNIDTAFVHSLGDLDYGLRARQLGCTIWVASGYLGTCPQNSVRGSWVDMQLPVSTRLMKVFQPKAFPVGAWTTFVRRHRGPFWFVYWMLPYLRAVVGYRNLSASPSFEKDS